MDEVKPASHGWMSGKSFMVTGYCCKNCGHFNDLKRRKGYKEYRENILASKHI
jgi:hypothetical protein